MRHSRCAWFGLFCFVMEKFDYHNPAWLRKRASILRRDGYKCQECKRYGRRRSAEIVHHKKPVEFYPELAFADENLISLCAKCHNKQHPEKGRKPKSGRGYPPTSDL